MKCSGKMLVMIILKVTKTRVSPSLSKTHFSKQILPPPPLNRVRFNSCYVILIKWTCYYFAMCKCLSTIVRVNGTV